ncbi:MAG: hypothetical protein HY399_01415 [Elusimicrobia bacterium]|nr:hypothetical protein [Elusimicrobiota bacterium]
MSTFESFKNTIEKDFFKHPVVTSNPYTQWFKQGWTDTEQLVDLITQFSVFSNHFLVVQVKRMVNASTEEGERSARYILMNECGVSIDSRTGSTEGRVFSTSNAHLNWLREIGALLGLGPMDLGQWEKGSESTHRFLQGLDRTYGNHDGQIGAGASFAIETWAASGIGHGPEAESKNFWKELIVGIEGYNRNHRLPLGLEPLPLGFFQYHFEIESGHGANVWHELEETFHQPGFDPKKFLRGGREALDAIHTFWIGLDQTRKSLERTEVREKDCLAAINVAQWGM